MAKKKKGTEKSEISGASKSETFRGEKEKMEQELEQPEQIQDEILEEAQKETKEKKQLGVTDLPGVGAATAEKLESVGYKDLMAIAVATPG